MNNNIVFCTITYGDKYIEFSKNLIKQITDRGYNFMVYTFEPAKYTPSNLLKVIENPNPYFSFHQKLEILKIALEDYDTVFFLDADVEIIGEADFTVLDNIESGLHIFSTFGTIYNHFLNRDCKTPNQKMGNRNGKYGEEGEQLLIEHNFLYKKSYHNGLTVDYLEHFLEGRWLLKKDDGKENEFIRIWDILRKFTEKKDIELNFLTQIGAGEGAHMSIAAHNSGIKMHIVSPLSTFVKTHFISNYQEKVRNEKPWNIAG